MDQPQQEAGITPDKDSCTGQTCAMYLPGKKSYETRFVQGNILQAQGRSLVPPCRDLVPASRSLEACLWLGRLQFSARQAVPGPLQLLL